MAAWRRLLVVVAACGGFRPPVRLRGRGRCRGAEEGDEAGGEDGRRAPGVFDWLRERRDVFEPAWPWLTARREWSDFVKEGRRAEQVRLQRGKRLIEREIERFVAADREARDAAREFLEDEWEREERLRAGARLFLEDEWQREERLRTGAQLFLNDEWERERTARLEARAFVADEFERLGDADEELAARIRGAPEITVCAAPIACGKADGRRVYDRLRDASAKEADHGRPVPLVRCATKCASNCKAGRVAVTLGLPRDEVVYCEPADATCEDALGYCAPDEYEALVDANIDVQIDAILERARRRPPLFKTAKIRRAPRPPS